MTLAFPSPEFDDAVAAVCHGEADEALCRALNELLRNDAAALDEYILRTELHSRLGSDEDLFVAANQLSSVETDTEEQGFLDGGDPDSAAKPKRSLWWAWGVAALLVLAALGVWQSGVREQAPDWQVGSQAVAMLDRTVRARWADAEGQPVAGDSLEPGWLTLESGLAQIVFYKGARLIVEGPAEIYLLAPNHVSVRKGKITADIPSQSSGFRIDGPHASVDATVANVGFEAEGSGTAVHVFAGQAAVRPRNASAEESVERGIGILVTETGDVQRIQPDGSAFASLYDFHAESSAALALRRDYWEVMGERLNQEESLLVRLDFEQASPSRWELPNLSQSSSVAEMASVIGCQWGRGRWPGKQAIEFQNVNDRVRLDVPGEYDSLTLSAWVRVQGLDRELNSLFMSDGFMEKSIHWLLRDDGVLGMTVVGDQPGDYQIVASPPVVELDDIGRWIHLAVVVDGRSRRVSHFVNGQEVDREALMIKPPYRVGPSELGNWSARGFPEDDPFMIRNFSGSMDEFCLFSRALEPEEIETLYQEGRPDLDLLAFRR
ncbi:LamG domain-containing protein [Pelagicoccus sp. NFK12]|uniref:LamG domain-containing protein n=1 Tax=Pelagicoccus enzymogenes TaxID=2773457 RepID=A0A927F6C7_9BACT|nr:LamG domain-containing protein [Pelagicoccus enzymogenes]MBD5778056.1 LamG domain-containing protein [Pelagicoccus enzymogenes]